MKSEMSTPSNAARDRTPSFVPRVVSQLRDARERGAAMVEFALVAVVLFVIIFSLIEGGLLVRARNNMSSVADEGARRGAIAANQESADWQILQQLRARGALTSAQVNYVVVFKADTSTARPSAACLAGTPVTDECNVYERIDFEAPAALFNCTDANLDANWCPADRAQDETGFEYIGVYVDADYRGLVGILGIFDQVEVNSLSVLPLEGSGGI